MKNIIKRINEWLRPRQIAPGQIERKNTPTERELELVTALTDVLDQVAILNASALRSGNQKRIALTASLLKACFNHAARAGLQPFVAEPGELFNDALHYPVNGTPNGRAFIGATYASGFTLRGKLVRRATVVLRMP